MKPPLSSLCLPAKAEGSLRRVFIWLFDMFPVLNMCQALFQEKDLNQLCFKQLNI